MRILFASGLVHYPHLCGANKGNRILMEALAARGHEVRVVAPISGVPYPVDRTDLRRRLAASGIPIRASSALCEEFVLRGVLVLAVADPSSSRIKLRSVLRRQLDDYQPDCVLVAGEDAGQGLLRQALRYARCPVVHLVQTTQLLPCGPACPAPDPEALAILRDVAGTVVISRFLRGYLRRWADIDSLVCPYLALDPGPFRDLGRFDRGYVTLVNPSPLKGLAIFEALARRSPDVAFAAVPTWGQTPAVLRRLDALRNVAVLEPADDIERILEQTRVLLVPSVWQEAFGVVAVEAALRAIPVLASDVGGLPEASLGVGACLPVRPIRFDAGTLEPIEPPQDIEPWADALGALLSDRSHYERVARRSARRARRFVARIDVAHVEQYLARARPGRAPEPKKMPAADHAPPAGGG